MKDLWMTLKECVKGFAFVSDLQVDSYLAKTHKSPMPCQKNSKHNIVTYRSFIHEPDAIPSRMYAL